MLLLRRRRPAVRAAVLPDLLERVALQETANDLVDVERQRTILLAQLARLGVVRARSGVVEWSGGRSGAVGVGVDMGAAGGNGEVAVNSVHLQQHLVARVLLSRARQICGECAELRRERGGAGAAGGGELVELSGVGGELRMK